ncbi:hypothetical protein INT48_007616, partial [Thamnidium elegans]
MEIDHPEGSNSIRPSSQFVNYTPHNVMSLNEPSMNTLTEGVIKPVRRKLSRRPRKEVHVNVQDTWEKLRNTQVTMSVAEFLALNKNAAREVKEGIMYLHRRKPSGISTNPVMIGALRSNGLLDEEELLRRNYNRSNTHESSVKHFQSDEESNGESSETNCNSSSDDSEYDNSSESFYEESDDGESTIINYPYDSIKMRNARPVRVFVNIHNRLVEAILDSGAAVSVMSIRLARILNIKVNNEDRMVLSGFSSNKSVTCQVVTDVDVRIGGKRRIEHFCIDPSETGKEVCILGRSWIENHDIRLIKKGKIVMVPTNGGKDYVEVECIDDEKDFISNDVPIFQVSVRRDDSHLGESNEEDLSINKNKEININKIVSLSTYQEDTISHDSFIEDNEARQVFNEDESEGTPNFLNNLLESYRDCFVEYNEIGVVKNIKHHIRTTDEIPTRSKPYRLNYDEEDSLKEELKTLLDLKIIEPSDGKWSAPIFFVPKKDSKKLRLVVNYSALNAKTIKDGYPLPHIEEVLNALAGAKYFSTLDAATGFWQIAMAEDSIEKTGFVTKFGTFIFKVMPFGLTGAPACYQRAMSTLLNDFIGVFVYIFIDDILVFSKDEESHINHLQKIFEVCKANNLRIRKEKCQFNRNKVVYLGHEVGEKGIQPAEGNLKKIVKLKEPTNKDDVRSLLGATGYFRRFIMDYASRAEPLTKLLKKTNSFEWTDKQQDAFNYLISSLMSPPVQTFPIREYVKIITTDASYKGLGAILSQSPTGTDEEETVISYASKSINHANLNYTVTHLEALAIVWAVNRFRYYLASKEEFIIRTDHCDIDDYANK